MSVEVTLNDGTTKVRIKKLNWKGYRAVKNRISSVLRNDLPTKLETLALGTLASGGEVSMASLVSLAPLFVAGAEALDEITEDLIKGCCDPAQKVDDLEAGDVLLLRDAALAENPIDKLLEQEKNCLAGLFGRLTATVNGPETTPPEKDTPGG